MKKLLLTLLTVSICLIAVAQSENAKQVFESPKLKEAVKSHKTVAILPFTRLNDHGCQ